MITLGDLDPIPDHEAGKSARLESVRRVDDPSVVRRNIARGLGLGELLDLVGRGDTPGDLRIFEVIIRGGEINERLIPRFADQIRRDHENSTPSNRV